MIGSLVGLHVRRTATPVALAVVAGTGVIAFLGAPSGTDLVTISSALFDELIDSGETGAQSAWAASLFVLVILALLPASHVADRWFRSEGDWLGTAPTSRLRISASALLGVTLGCVLLAAAAGVVTGAHAVAGEHDEPLLEHALVAGPRRSIVLGSGESFEQSLVGSLLEGSSRPNGARVRIRVGPTLGGVAPTTMALHGTNVAERIERVARRTWLESDVTPATDLVRVTNVGDGALAVLGPRPVEVWRPSSAFARGHLRVAAHVALFLVVLAAMAFGLGAWMSPGIAALLAFSLWLGVRMFTVETAWAHWLPGGDGLAVSLSAIAEGRSPLRPRSATILVTLAICAASIACTCPALRSWRKEARA